MTLNNLHKAVKTIAILLWLIAIIIIAVAIIKHSIWNLMPIITHNHVQNYLGWIIVIAFILSICSPIIKIIAKPNRVHK